MRIIALRTGETKVPNSLKVVLVIGGLLAILGALAYAALRALRRFVRAFWPH
jgi:hypothetical protein